MRLSHVCDEMNITGCTEWQKAVNELTGIKWFLFHYQLEAGLILGIIGFGIIMYYTWKYDKKGRVSE